MNNGVAGVAIILAVTIGWFMHSDREEKREAQERLAFENSRVTTSDPLLNLAGCMANHATELSTTIIASAIYKTDNNIKMSSEQIESYDKARDLLLQACAKDYFPKVTAARGEVTYPELNQALFTVMRKEQSVQKHINLLSTVDGAVKSAYVKQ
jgi:hypothetical protein